MSRAGSLAVWVVFASVASSAAGAEDLTVTGPLTIGSPASYDNVVVTGTGILTLGAPLTVTANMTVQSGGVVTHALRDTAGVVLDVTDTLDVQAGGAIDVSAKGLRGGQNGSAFGFQGEAFDPTGASIVAGSTRSGAGTSGGAYGGSAARFAGTVAANAPYGALDDPRHVGSGGAGLGNDDDGGHGGGRVTLAAEVLIVDGAIRANGGPGVFAGAGGSGGGVKIAAGTVSGSGQISAIGGSASGNATSGSGGRIAVRYDAMTLPVASLTARAGSSTTGDKSASGTVYLKDNAASAGDLIVDNGGLAATVETPLRMNASTLRSASVRNQGRLVVDASGLDLHGVTVSGGSFAVAANLAIPDGNDLVLSSAAALTVRSPAVLTLGHFDPTNIQAGTVSLDIGARIDVVANAVTVGSGVTLTKDGSFGAADQVGSLTVQSGGVVTHALRDTAGVVLNVTGVLEVQAGGAIDVSARGLRGGQNGSAFGFQGEAFDATGTSIVAGSTRSGSGTSGAAYGGVAAKWAGVAAVNAPYGLLENPRHVGSGGGGLGNDDDGGHGGGRVTIVAGTLTIDGAVRANGGPGIFAGGGGSGGGIKIAAGTVAGAGHIEAKGGSVTGNSTSGSGGRIAVLYDTITFPAANLTARAGSSTSTDKSSSAGTIYLKDNAEARGDLIVDNGGVSGLLWTPLMTQLSAVRDLTVRNQGALGADLELEIHRHFDVTAGGRVGRP